MTKDPYEVLGVPKDADQETIKKQYRKKAKAMHPDHGGTGDAITDLTTAYSVLSDPDKRERFDRTGETEAPNIQSQVYAEFCKICEEILFKEAGRPLKENVSLFKANLEMQYSQAKAKNNRQRKILEAAKGRILKAPEVDPLSGVIAQRLDDLNKQDEDMEQTIAIGRQALDMFDQYVFSEPEPKASIKGFSISMNGNGSIFKV